MPELCAQDGGLQLVQTAVDADELVEVSLPLAMNAQHAQALLVLLVAGYQHAAVARAAEIL